MLPEGRADLGAHRSVVLGTDDAWLCRGQGWNLTWNQTYSLEGKMK